MDRVEEPVLVRGGPRAGQAGGHGSGRQLRRRAPHGLRDESGDGSTGDDDRGMAGRRPLVARRARRRRRRPRRAPGDRRDPRRLHRRHSGSQRRRTADDHHAHALAHLARRRRHRYARRTTGSPAGLPHRGGHHEAHLHRGEPQLRGRHPAQVLEGRAGARRRRSSTASSASRLLCTGVGRGRDLVDGRHPGRHRAGLVRRVHRRRASALHAYRRSIVANRELAEQACHIEIDRLGEPIGKQDQYIAAVGGLSALRVPRRRVGRGEPGAGQRRGPALPRGRSPPLLHGRSAAGVRGPRRPAGSRPPGAEPQPRRGDATSATGRRTRSDGGDLAAFGASLRAVAAEVRPRPTPVTIGRSTTGSRPASPRGALGGKLVGAGGGGFLLFYAEDKARLRSAMADSGLHEVRFGFDYMGPDHAVDS